MRVLKNKDQSFLAGIFAMDGKLLLSTAALLFFDLRSPQTPLPEKELWQLVKKRIPKPTPFDTAMPKPQAEVLVYGACHPRQGDADAQEAQEAQEAAFAVGSLRKRLFVFGPRHWEKTRAGWKIVHDAPLAAPLPLVWQHAFGGPGFKDNPLGRGAAVLTDGKGGEFRPLPQIENPDNLIGSVDDRPEPAATCPVDQTWPRRLKKAGTYDKKWLEDHWPQLPPDFDLRFFNTAPDDQQIKGYFRGDEAIRITGMHPLHRRLDSRLPGLRVRCFVTLRDTPRPDSTGVDRSAHGATFQELETRLDTVWLFPDELRGALCFRGVCEVKDDEYRDVASVMLVTEALDAPAQPLEHYRELRDTWVERMVTVDTSGLEAGKQSIAQALNRLQALPAEIDKRLEQSLGKTPRAPAGVEQKFASAHSRLEASEALLDRLESTAAGLREKHGHLARIDLSHFARLRQTIASQRAGLQQAAKDMDSALDGARKQREAAAKTLAKQKQDLAARGVKVGFDPDDILLPPREQRWQREAMRRLGLWQRELRHDAPLLETLHGMGLSDVTIEDALLGCNPAPLEAESRTWGLDPAQDEVSDTFVIPPGLVLPQFQDAQPVALRIRPAAAVFPPVGKDQAVPGSTPLAMAPCILSASPGRLFVRVADQLEALLLVQEAGDLCTVAVMSTPDTPLGDAGEALLKQAPAFVVALRGENAEDVENQWQNWREAFPEALRLPVNHGGPVEARRQGRDLRAMLRQLVPAEKTAALPPDPEPPVQPADVQPGMPLPFPDIRKIIADARDKTMTVMEEHVGPLRKEAEALRSQAMEQAAATLRRQGLDPEEHLAARAGSKTLDVPALKKELREALASAKEQLARHDQLKPDVEQKLDNGLEGAMKLLDNAAAAFPASGGPPVPQWAQDLRARHGLDPETGTGPDRALIAAMLEAGNKDFSGRNLSGLDLSGLDFSGAQLQRAICIKTSFRDANLEGADLSRALCKQADLGNAGLHNANLERCVLHKALLPGARLQGAHCSRALLAEADCSGADLGGSDLSRAVLLHARLSGASMAGARLERTVFNDTQLQGADLSGATLQRTLFISCNLDGLDFSGLHMRKTVFMGCSGAGVVFRGADMHNVRFLKRCSLPEAILAGANLQSASAMDCDFTRADLREAVLNRALFQNCAMQGAVLWHARARQARLLRCDLEGANMRGLDLLQGSLRKSRLVAADLSGANLFAADLFKAVLGNTTLDLAYTRRSLLENREDLLP